MKKSYIYIFAILLGAAIGYRIGIKSDLARSGLIAEILFGAAFGYTIVVGFLEIRDGYAILVGAAIGLLISLALDWIAGSPLDFSGELSYMILCSFVGWGYRWGWAYWVRVLVGGFIVGIIGFLMGLNSSQWFGRVHLLPGLLNAELTFMRYFMLGTALSSLYLKSFGWRLISNRIQG